MLYFFMFPRMLPIQIVLLSQNLFEKYSAIAVRGTALTDFTVAHFTCFAGMLYI